jgi:hypothetical protein
MSRPTLPSLALLASLLTTVLPCNAQTDFEARNKEGLSRNPGGVTLLLRTEDGRSAFHLFETIPIELDFSSTRPLTYSIELDEMMNTAGQANNYQVSPAGAVFLPYAQMGSRSFSCCASDRHYLDSRPTTLRRELTDQLRFARPGTYSVFLVTNRVFRGLGKPDNFDPSKLTLTSNLLTLTILPDDPEWDSQKLEETLRDLNDPQIRANYLVAITREKKLDSGIAQDFERLNHVERTKYARAQKALNALDTGEAIHERVKLMEKESKTYLDISREHNSATILWQPLLASTTRPDLVVEAMNKQAGQPEFGVDYTYLHWWVHYLVQRDHPELFRPRSNESERENRIHDYLIFQFQARRALTEGLEVLLPTKTVKAADVTALTIQVTKSFESRIP